MTTYIFDVQRVACDPLHGFQQEAGQRHTFTPVVCRNFLMGYRTTGHYIMTLLPLYCIDLQKILGLIT